MQRCPYIHEMRERFFNEQPTSNPQQQPIPLIPPPSKFYLPSKQSSLVQQSQPQSITTVPLKQFRASPPPPTQTNTQSTTMPIRGGIDRESEREGLIDVRQSSALSGASSNQVGTVVKVGAILASGPTNWWSFDLTIEISIKTKTNMRIANYDR